MVINTSFETNPNSVTNLLQHHNFSSLNQLQDDTINAGLLEDQNFLIALPTGSGKTLLSIIKSQEIIEKDQQIIFLTPTRVLNDQIYQIFRERFVLTKKIEGGMKTSQVKEALQNFQVLVSTFEKFEIVFRKNSKIIDNVGLIIVDEIHLLSDRQRGPAYELIISLLLFLQVRDKWTGSILAMSGSVHNPKEIALWMKAGYIHSKERMIPFQPFVVDVDLRNNSLQFYSKPKDRDEFISEKVSILQILTPKYPNLNLEYLYSEIPRSYLTTISTCLYLISKGQRVLILCSTQLETKLLNQILLKTIDVLKWEKINSLFHHAGMSDKNKKRVELLCTQGVVDCIFATTTFSMGVDYLFDAVILTFHSLYDKMFDWKKMKNQHSEELSISQVLMIQQIIGRVGHQGGSSAFIYCIGKSFTEGLQIYKSALEHNPGIQSNLNTYIGKMKFHEVLNIGLMAGWFQNLRDIIDFSGLTLYSSNTIDYISDQLNPQQIKTRENVIFDEIGIIHFSRLIN